MRGIFGFSVLVLLEAAAADMLVTSSREECWRGVATR